jgi:hypothetical protein
MRENNELERIWKEEWTNIRYCGISARSKNRRARETAVASEWLGSNIRLQATAAKQAVERPLLGSRFLISEKRRPLLGNG